MKNIKQKIINALQEKGSELSTSEIMPLVSEDYKISKGNRMNEQARHIRRKVLYHINILIREKILKIERYGKNGHKILSLNIGEGEEICEIAPSRYKKRALNDFELFPKIPIEKYEKQGVIIKYEPLEWTNKLNSVLISCNKIKNFRLLMKTIEKTFPIINDCVCLNNFEFAMNKDDFSIFFKSLQKKSENHRKKISCIINIADVKKNFNFILENIGQKNIEFIYSISQENKEESFRIIRKIVDKYSEIGKAVHIKNSGKCEAPWFIGKAGVYTFDENEWNSKDRTSCIGCSQSSVIVDVKKFYDIYGFNVRQFTELLMNISKSFLTVNPMQRRKLREYFEKNILEKNEDFLELSRNHIRFWNFGLLQPNLNQNKVLSVISKAREKIDEFCKIEDRIFNSCGLPIRFKLALSTALKRSEAGLSRAKYKKIEFKGIEDLQNNVILEQVKNMKNVCHLFDGGNRMSFSRKGFNVDSEKATEEIFFILNNFEPRFFSYGFRGF